MLSEGGVKTNLRTRSVLNRIKTGEPGLCHKKGKATEQEPLFVPSTSSLLNVRLTTIKVHKLHSDQSKRIWYPQSPTGVALRPCQYPSQYA